MNTTGSTQPGDGSLTATRISLIALKDTGFTFLSINLFNKLLKLREHYGQLLNNRTKKPYHFHTTEN